MGYDSSKIKVWIPDGRYLFAWLGNTEAPPILVPGDTGNAKFGSEASRDAFCVCVATIEQLPGINSIKPDPVRRFFGQLSYFYTMRKHNTKHPQTSPSFCIYQLSVARVVSRLPLSTAAVDACTLLMWSTPHLTGSTPAQESGAGGSKDLGSRSRYAEPRSQPVKRAKRGVKGWGGGHSEFVPEP